MNLASGRKKTKGDCERSDADFHVIINLRLRYRGDIVFSLRMENISFDFDYWKIYRFDNIVFISIRV